MQSPAPSTRARRAGCAALACAALLFAPGCASDVPTAAERRADYQSAMQDPDPGGDARVEGSTATQRASKRPSWSQHARQARRHLAAGETQAAESEFLLSLAETEPFPARDARSRTAVKNLAMLADRYARDGDDAGIIRITPPLIAGLQRVDGPDDPQISTAWLRLGEARLAQGDGAAAAVDLERALELLRARDERQLEAETETTLSLALAYLDQGKIVEAESLYRRATEEFDELRLEERGTALSLNALAWFYVGQARYVDAEPFARRAVDIAMRLQLPPVEVAQIHDTLAAALAGQGRNPEAEAEYERAVELSRGAPQILRDYAEFLRGIGETSRADELLERAETAEKGRAPGRRSSDARRHDVRAEALA